jgi:hypothetical protein
VFVRARGLSASASEPGPAGLSSVREDAAPRVHAVAECEDVDFEPSDMSSSSDNDGSGQDAFFIRPA